MLHPEFEIYTARVDGSDVRRITHHAGYDAEATISRDGKKIVFTSLRNGDLDIYTMDPDGQNVQRLTTELGYDGGPFFSADGTKVVYRAYHPKSVLKLSDYESLLKRSLIKPTRAEIFMMNADGSHQRQITQNGAANWAPFLHPNNRQIIFSSNLHDPERRTFSLYVGNTDGTGLKRLTSGARFDSFPMISKDGSKLVFASTRNGANPAEFNIFIADWLP